MVVFLALIVFILFAFSVSLIAKTNSIESLFIGIISVTFMCMLLLYFLSLTYTVYIVCSIISLLLLGSIIFCIINKTFISGVKIFFINPSFIILIIMFTLYYFSIRNTVPLSFDNFSHWLRAPKAILHYDGIRNTQGAIYSNQTVEMPILYSFIAFFTGFRFDALLSYMWFIYFLALLLPFSNNKLNKIYIVALFCIIAFSLIMTDYNAYSQLYSDTIITTVFTGLVCYYYLNRKSKAKNMVIILGLTFLSQVKNGMGILYSIFALTIFVFDTIYHDNKKRSIRNYIYLIISLLAIIISSYYSKVLLTLTKAKEADFVSYFSIINNIKKNALVLNNPWCNPIGSAISALTSTIGLILILSIIIVLTIIIVKRLLKQNINKWLIVIQMMPIVVLAGYVFINLDSGTYILLRNFFKALLTVKFINIELPILTIIIVVVSALLYRYLFDIRTKKYFKYLSVIIIFEMIVLCAATIYKYSQCPISTIDSGNSMERYIGGYVFFVILSIVIMLFSKKEYHKYVKHKDIAYSIVLVLVLLTIYPAPLTLYNHSVNSLEKYNFYQYEEDADKINNEMQDDDKLLILIDKINTDGGDYTSTTFSYFTLTSKEYIILYDILGDTDVQLQALQEFIKVNEVTKVYVMGSSPLFREQFAPIFSDEIFDYTIYNVNWNNKDNLTVVLN